MTRIFVSIIAMFFAITGGVLTSASAQQLESWGTADPWEILIDHSIGAGCFIQAEFDNGSLVRIGIDKERGQGYVSAYNDAWGDIEDGKIYAIEFALDGQSYDGEAEGVHLAGTPGADIYFDSEDFFWDIMRKNVLTLYNENGEVMAISLEGTFVGLEGVLECQEEVDAQG